MFLYSYLPHYYNKKKDCRFDASGVEIKTMLVHSMSASFARIENYTKPTFGVAFKLLGRNHMVEMRVLYSAIRMIESPLLSQ